MMLFFALMVNIILLNNHNTENFNIFISQFSSITYSALNSDVRRLTSGYDQCGFLCGVNNQKIGYLPNCEVNNYFQLN